MERKWQRYLEKRLSIDSFHDSSIGPHLLIFQEQLLLQQIRTCSHLHFTPVAIINAGILFPSKLEQYIPNLFHYHTYSWRTSSITKGAWFGEKGPFIASHRTTCNTCGAERGDSHIKDRLSDWIMGLPEVLMVAEKPSIAGSVANILSKGKHDTRGGKLPVHYFEGTFMGQKVLFKVGVELLWIDAIR